MSECVVRMEMPSGCHDCKLRNMVGNCPIPMFDGQDEKKMWTLEECFQRPPWCPIICSLPEGHGRLIDGSNLAEKHRKLAYKDNSKYDFHIAAKAWVEESITIVPAERSEK